MVSMRRRAVFLPDAPEWLGYSDLTAADGSLTAAAWNNNGATLAQFSVMAHSGHMAVLGATDGGCHKDRTMPSV